MAVTDRNCNVSELIEALNAAILPSDDASRCMNVKQVLEDFIQPGVDFLPAEFLKPHAERYARRLVHADPQGRYTVLAMVWGPGQATPLHDHASMWCVECVYRGRIRVTSYAALGGSEALRAFEREAEIIAGVGEAGALIPPFEYHTIANADDTPSVTIHVYGGEMTECHVYLPTSDDRYRRERRALSYTD